MIFHVKKMDSKVAISWAGDFLEVTFALAKKKVLIFSKKKSYALKLKIPFFFYVMYTLDRKKNAIYYF